ncbi:MAG: GxxExxY protein [Patescibacteria group bacterium]|nr:GxxExxY protein [Patescibacteria group bacterium]
MKTKTENKGKVDDFLYEDLSYKLRGCAFEVYNRLGFGHKESVYQKAFAEELKKAKIPFEQEKSLGIKYRNKTIGRYRPDFIIDEKIIIEMKAVETMPKSYEQQLVHYLKSTGYKLGFLINFGGKKIDIRRRVWSLEYQRKSAINRCKSVLALFVAIATILLVGNTPIFAQTPREVGVEVSPLSLEKEVAPGEEINFAVTFTNPLESTQSIRPKFRDLRLDEGGQVQFLDYSSKRYTISRWASFPKDVIELGLEESKAVSITVKVPMDAVTGGHFGAFFGEVRDESLEEARGPFGVDQQVAPGCLVFLSVLGEDVMDADWAGDVDLRVLGFRVGNLFLTHKPISVDVMFRNRGIFHQNVWGGLFLREKIFGDEQDIRLREKKVLPDGYAVYSGEVSPRSWFGRYEIESRLLYGRDGDQEISENHTIWVVNPRVFIAIALIGIFTLLWVRRRSNSTGSS